MKTTRLKIGLYVNDPAANLLKFVRAFRNWGLAFQSIWRDELTQLRPGDVDVLLLHGGWYGIDRDPAQEQHVIKDSPAHRTRAEAVRRFVRTGGGVVGVCCGAYNVVWLRMIPAEISRTMGVGMHELEVVNAKHPLLRGVIERTHGHKDRTWKRLPAVRLNGPMFFPKDRSHLVLSYDWEQRLGAVLAADYGQGRAVAISPHPECTENEREDILTEPPMRVVALLRNALYWSARRSVPRD